MHVRTYGWGGRALLWFNQNNGHMMITASDKTGIARTTKAATTTTTTRHHKRWLKMSQQNQKIQAQQCSSRRPRERAARGHLPKNHLGVWATWGHGRAGTNPHVWWNHWEQQLEIINPTGWWWETLVRALLKGPYIITIATTRAATSKMMKDDEEIWWLFLWWMTTTATCKGTFAQ